MKNGGLNMDGFLFRIVGSEFTNGELEMKKQNEPDRLS